MKKRTIQNSNGSLINARGKLIISFTALSLMFNFYFSSGQNLIPNWSFEDVLACPNNLDQIDRAIGWSSYSQSPDYFSTCANVTTLVSVPNNFSGSHYPRTGIAYGGFIVGPGYREYLGVQLAQSLIIGQIYYASFYVCRAGNINRNCANNKIGIHLSLSSYSYTSPAPTNNLSQVFSDSVVEDTVNWTRISGSFVADSSYNFLSLGNFFVDSLTTYITYDSVHVQSYYYVDDIILSTDSNCCPIENIGFQSEGENFLVFPNPANNRINIHGENILSVTINDVYGNKYHISEIYNSSKSSLDVSYLKEGIYILLINTKSTTITKKIIIE